MRVRVSVSDSGSRQLGLRIVSGVGSRVWGWRKVLGLEGARRALRLRHGRRERVRDRTHLVKQVSRQDLVPCDKKGVELRKELANVLALPPSGRPSKSPSHVESSFEWSGKCWSLAVVNRNCTAFAVSGNCWSHEDLGAALVGSAGILEQRTRSVRLC